jgi:hypothetical protein
MALLRFLIAPALLAAAIVVGGGARHRAPRPPAPADAQAGPGTAAMVPSPPLREGREGTSPRRARTPR